MVRSTHVFSDTGAPFSYRQARAASYNLRKPSPAGLGGPRFAVLSSAPLRLAAVRNLRQYFAAVCKGAVLCVLHVHIWKS